MTDTLVEMEDDVVVEILMPPMEPGAIVVGREPTYCLICQQALPGVAYMIERHEVYSNVCMTCLGYDVAREYTPATGGDGNQRDAHWPVWAKGLPHLPLTRVEIDRVILIGLYREMPLEDIGRWLRGIAEARIAGQTVYI